MSSRKVKAFMCLCLISVFCFSAVMLSGCCDHNYKITENTATCTKSGVATYTCQYCLKSYQESYAMLGHNYVVASDTATCEKGGTATYKCKNCSATYEVTSAPKGHKFVSDVCSVCKNYKYHLTCTNNYGSVGNSKSAGFYGMSFATSSGQVYAVLTVMAIYSSVWLTVNVYDSKGQTVTSYHDTYKCKTNTLVYLSAPLGSTSKYSTTETYTVTITTLLSV